MRATRLVRRSLLVTFGLAAAAAWPSLRAEEVGVQSAGNKVTVARGALMLVFDPSGAGFITSAKRGEAEVCSAPDARGSGLFASLIVPSEEPKPLQPIRGTEVFGKATAETVSAKKTDKGGEVIISGKLSFGGLGDAPFTVTVLVPPSGPAMAASAELKLPDAARKGYLTSFGLAVPLKLRFHPSPGAKTKFDKTTAAAILPRVGTPIPEIRRLTDEQDRTTVWGAIFWTLAGIRQSSPTSCQVWEAWTTQNPPFVLQYHAIHPGWMAVADSENAVAAGFAGIEKIAPNEIYVDSQAKVLRLCFQSPYCRPLELGAGPTQLAAGPAYVFLEESTQEALNPESYRDAKRRPGFAAAGEDLGKLPATSASFGGNRKVLPIVRTEPPLEPADAEFGSHEPGSQTEIPIWVDEPQGASFDAFPVTRGIPLARGVLKDAKKAALLDADGKAIPCVARTVASWPDGSTKWLLLDSQVPLKAGVGAKLKLVVGDKAAPAPIPKPLAVTEAPNEVSVNTGRLKLTLANRDGKVALSIGLDLNGDGAFSEEETIVKPGPDVLACVFSHIQETESYRSGTWIDPGEPDPGVPEIIELKIEEQSPLRAVVLVRANLKHKLLASTIDPKQRPKGGTPVSLRFHLYAGSSIVRVQHTFLFAGDVRYDFLSRLGVRLPVPPQPGQKVTAELDGSLVGLSREGEGGLLQDGPDSALAWQETKRGMAGRAAYGWLDVSNKKWGVTVGLRHMREMFPQEIHIDKEGIWANFYSPRVPPMDLRRYAFHYGDGESTSTGWGTAFGALRTSEAVWFFHTGGAEWVKGSARVKAMLDPPLARVRPRHVADTLAVGHVAEWGAATNDAHMDAVTYHLPRMHRHNRDFWRWFGFWNFGDEIQVYDAGRARWALDDGRYGWYNNEPIRDYNYHLAYLMTGNRRIWEAAEAMSKHVFEVDVRHANPQPFMNPSPDIRKANYTHSTTGGIDLSGGRHNCQHWSDGYFGPRIGSPAGFRLAYYQTGDPVLHEYMERILAAAMKTRRREYMGADGDETMLWAMLMGYEMTLDPKYLDRIKGYTGVQVEFAKANNGIPAAQANWDWATNKPGAPPKDARDDLWIWSFGGSVGLIEVADLLNDPKIDEFLCNWTKTLEGAGPDAKRRTAWSNQMAAAPLLAFYYRKTGDPKALEWFQQRLKGFHSGIPKEAPKEDLPSDAMVETLPAYTPNDGYGWVYTTTTFWYVGIPAWQGALRAQAKK